MLKRSLSLLLSVVLVITCMSFNVFADDSSIPENAEKHTITITVPGTDDEIVDSGNTSVGGDTAEPYIWGQPSTSVGAGSTVSTSSFYIPERYFAYEMTSSNNSSATYSVSLCSSSGSLISTMSGYANGGTYKNDWITISTYGNYHFSITNNSSTALTVKITYYSWS